MPIYEYTAQDGTKIELIRPMADADKPVTDPEGKGRTFTRVMSTFASGGGAAQAGGGHVHSGMCGCGKRKGSCGN
ncbi:MAG TPA: hypothetical protein VFF65_03535 [Phycisphaerales bacterium]|nr:hypothetical protein [Phycisphaerales bacterium]